MEVKPLKPYLIIAGFGILIIILIFLFAYSLDNGRNHSRRNREKCRCGNVHYHSLEDNNDHELDDFDALDGV